MAGQSSGESSSPGRQFFILSLSSACGLGYIPVAPGTFGTLAALPLWWLFSAWPWWLALGLTLAMAALAIAVSAQAERLYGGHDNRKIVIDEVAGMLVTVFGVPFAGPQIAVAFVLFRVLDATKPPPIRWFDQNVGGGLGVVADDLVAGVIGLALLHGTRWVLGAWW